MLNPLHDLLSYLHNHLLTVRLLRCLLRSLLIVLRRISVDKSII